MECIGFGTDGKGIGRQRFSGKAYDILFTVLLAVPVFFVFVLLDSRSGYAVLDYRPADLFPPIPLYLADYSLCFSSRLLIGSLTKLFTYQLTLDQLYDVCVTMNILALVIVSLLCGAVLLKGIKAKSGFALFVSLLFILNPVVSQENYPAIGSYDTYWLVLFAVMLLLFDTYGLAVTAPFLCFTGMLIHYGFLFAFLPCIIALLVYDFVNAEKKSKRIISGISAVVTGLSSSALLIFTFVFQNKGLKMTGPEFHEYLLSRLKLTGVEEIHLRRLFGDNLFPYDFFEIYFFNNRDDSAQIDMKPGRFLELFRGYIQDTTSVEYYVKYALLLLPFIFIFAFFWCVCIKKAKGLKKIPFVCFAGIELFLFAACMFSTDVYRWGAAAMISQMSLLLAMFIKKDPVASELLCSPFFKKKWVIALMLLIVIAVSIGYFKIGIHLPRTVDR